MLISKYAAAGWLVLMIYSSNLVSMEITVGCKRKLAVECLNADDNISNNKSFQSSGKFFDSDSTIFLAESSSAKERAWTMECIRYYISLSSPKARMRCPRNLLKECLEARLFNKELVNLFPARVGQLLQLFTGVPREPHKEESACFELPDTAISRILEYAGVCIRDEANGIIKIGAVRPCTWKNLPGNSLCVSITVRDALTNIIPFFVYYPERLYEKLSLGDPLFGYVARILSTSKLLKPVFSKSSLCAVSDRRGVPTIDLRYIDYPSPHHKAPLSPSCSEKRIALPPCPRDSNGRKAYQCLLRRYNFSHDPIYTGRSGIRLLKKVKNEYLEERGPLWGLFKKYINDAKMHVEGEQMSGEEDEIC